MATFANEPFEGVIPIRKKSSTVPPTSAEPVSAHPTEPLPSEERSVSVPVSNSKASTSVEDSGGNFPDFSDAFILNEPLPILPPEKVSKALPAIPGFEGLVAGNSLVTGNPLDLPIPEAPLPEAPLPEAAPEPKSEPKPEPVLSPSVVTPQPAVLPVPERSPAPAPVPASSEPSSTPHVPVGQATQRKVGVLGEALALDYLLVMLETAKKLGATDLHFKAGEPAEIRTVRGIGEFPQPELRKKISGTSVYALFEYFLQFSPSTDRKLFEDAGYLDFAVKIDDVSMRLSAFMENSGLCLAVRFFNQKALSLDFVGIRQLADILKKPSGLFMTTGPTGSGKTTTLAAMIEHLNSTECKHIATVEDPVEYVFTDKRCRITQRSIPAHVKDFATGLVSMLRQDPDVIMIGELRTVDVMRTTLLAAESGHLVLTTMHASSAVQAVSRFASYFPSDAQQWAKALLCEVLLGATNQRLLPNPDRTKRVLCAELMLMTTAMTNLIKEGKYKEAQDSIQRSPGMLDWDTSLDKLLLTNQIDYETWRLNLRNPDRARPKI